MLRERKQIHKITGEFKMFDGKNNELLDSMAFRMGVHTAAFWGWMAVVILLLSAAGRGF